MNRRDRAEFDDPLLNESTESEDPRSSARRDKDTHGLDRAEGTRRRRSAAHDVKSHEENEGGDQVASGRRRSRASVLSPERAAAGEELTDLPLDDFVDHDPGGSHPSMEAEPSSRTRTRSRRMTTPQPIRASTFASKALPRGRSVRVSMPRGVQQSSLLRDHMGAVLLGTAVFSLILLWITVFNRIGSLPEVGVLRYDAEGLPARAGNPRGLLQMPLLATFTLVMNLVVAWTVAESDRFAARIVLAGAILIQLLLWVAVILLIW